MSPAPSSSSTHGSLRRPDDHVIVLFGATGDLAKRKLLPGLFHLTAARLMPEHFRIVGTAPPQFAMSDAEFKKHARDAVSEFGNAKPTGKAWTAFESALSFGAADPEDASALVSAVHVAETAIGGKPRRLFHLAVPPSRSSQSWRCSVRQVWPKAQG